MHSDGWHSSRLSAINSNSCIISSSKTVILWLLYIIFILLFGSVSSVSPESAPTRAEWKSRISSPRLWYFHTHYRIAPQDTLSLSLSLWHTPTDPFPELWGRTVQSHKNSVKWSQTFKCRLHAVDANYVHITFLLHNLKADYERAEGGPPNIILRAAFPTQNMWSTGAKKVMTGVSGWCWCVL